MSKNVFILSLFFEYNMARHEILGLTVNFFQFIENNNPLSSDLYCC